jgi:hypothetical protein
LTYGDGEIPTIESSIDGEDDGLCLNTGGVQFGWKYAGPRYPPSAPFLSASVIQF